MSAGASILPGLFKVSLVSGAPSVITDGNTVGWYLADDLTTITKDGSNFVSRWNDKLLSGHDLLQATGTNQPLWITPGTILFDGVDNFMKCNAFTWNRPMLIYMIVKQITWTSGDAIFDGDTANYSVLTQFTATPGLRMAGGAGGTVNNNLVLDTWGIIRAFFITGAGNSKLQINNIATTADNVAYFEAGGFTLAVVGNIGGGFSNIQVKEIILRKIADSSGDETNIYNYLVTRLP